LSDDDVQVSHVLWRPNRNLCLVKCNNGLINEDAVTQFKLYLSNEKLVFLQYLRSGGKVKFLKPRCSDLWSKFSTEKKMQSNQKWVVNWKN
jgi:hypothetical protein